MPERRSRALLGLAVVVLAAACDPVTTARRDTGLDGLSLTSLEPATMLVGTKLFVEGRSFVEPSLGETTLVVAGVNGTVRLPGVYQSSSELLATADAALIAALGETAAPATVTIEIVSTVDGRRYTTPALQPMLRGATTLVPTIGDIGDGVVFINQPISLAGGDLLLGGEEGSSRVVLTGCFRPASGGICGLPQQTPIALVSDTPTSRSAARFPYATAIAGIQPGLFTGTLTVENVHQDGTITSSAAATVSFDVQPAVLSGTSTSEASLGQYVVLSGGGFVGGGGAAGDELTTLLLKGAFQPAGGGKATDLDVQLIPEFRSGLELRYVLDTEDELGRAINLRQETGTIAATVELRIQRGAEIVTTEPVFVQLGILPVRQVVYVHFLDEWIAALRRFGLRAADGKIRERILAIGRRDYQAINLDFRQTLPTDFAIFSQVDLDGLYPAGDHSFGYDNTPGKDTNNQRLYDRIGGVNAVTQQNGDPGYGGVFLESFFLFSENPPADIRNNLQRDPAWESARHPLFDPIFDPFRADRGGRELTASELALLDPPTLETSAGCPSSERRQQLACAIFVMGSLIGSTMTHELGHSLGLADPYGAKFHNPGDCPERLMDGGADRTFLERAELGTPPSRFCTEDYAYLRSVLPSLDVPPLVERPGCAVCLQE